MNLSYFLNINVSSNPYPPLRLASDLFPSGFPTKSFYAFLVFPIHAICRITLMLFA
jgi:hypothetical protein